MAETITQFPTDRTPRAQVLDTALASIESAALAEFAKCEPALREAGFVHLLDTLVTELAAARHIVWQRFTDGER